MIDKIVIYFVRDVQVMSDLETLKCNALEVNEKHIWWFSLEDLL